MKLSDIEGGINPATIRVHESDRLVGTIGLGEGFLLPGDKSISHRAILLSTLAEGVSTITNLQISGVTQVMINGLRKMGLGLDLIGSTLHVHGSGLGSYRSPDGPINCGNSATSLRLMAGAIAANGIEVTLDGSDGLRRRPMERIIEPLRRMGVRVESVNGHAPLTIIPGNFPLQGLDFSLPVASAQVKSCILLAGLAAEGKIILKEPGPSRDHTEKMLTSMGVPITTKQSANKEIFITEMNVCHPVVLSPLVYDVPGDISAASFLIVAAAIVPGSEVRINRVLLNPTRTGLLEALINMGADITLLNVAQFHGELVGDILVRHRALSGIDIDGTLVVRMIDEFPIFSIAAACAQGITRVRDADELRHKESDRITALCLELTKIGIEARECSDGFDITGGKPISGGEVDPHGDHRLAMALSVAGLVSSDPVLVRNAQIIQESFPGFFGLLQNIGANIEMAMDQ